MSATHSCPTPAMVSSCGRESARPVWCGRPHCPSSVPASHVAPLRAPLATNDLALNSPRAQVPRAPAALAARTATALPRRRGASRDRRAAAVCAPMPAASSQPQCLMTAPLRDCVWFVMLAVSPKRAQAACEMRARRWQLCEEAEPHVCECPHTHTTSARHIHALASARAPLRRRLAWRRAAYGATASTAGTRTAGTATTTTPTSTRRGGGACARG